MEDLRSGIEHLKQAKAHMSEANGIMSDHISKLKSLEEENAALKAELDDWKGNAEGFEPEAYMKLPLDADGVPIRLGDKVYGKVDIPFKVDEIRFSAHGEAIIVAGVMKDGVRSAIARQGGFWRHEQPDSWEKLEEDAKRQSCWYFGMDRTAASCDDCPHGWAQTGRACWRNARLDILARAKKLAGIEEEAER